MDIDKILHTKVEVNNDREKLTSYNLSRGPSYSLNENLVPEQLFDDQETEEKKADGISATKAISLAAQQGQTIYTVTKSNYAEVLPKLNHSDVVMTDIRNGVFAGKTVTVHDTELNFNGWSGTGYTILDPESGAGAYMIGGGIDGGFLNYIGDNANGFALALGITSVLATLGPVGLPILTSLIILTFFVAVLVTMATNLALIDNECPDSLVLLNTVLNMAGFLLTSFLKGTGQVIVGAIANFIYNSIVPAASPLCKFRY